ncbi:hypothetical protein GCM10008107_04890 [Psychrosphaera saromensis]|uniref:DUF3592 domain-containing protein n=1 Tax=Psychrosphaera saromensis TaxID=716813 RepID=A0A2S7UXZ3_9GAMM|nr:hypothetical protein [Psychrosphaera saromensis]PQJ54575.1 hypothetical protein BTO11_13580 [Psychrosphaera saromensis]GHB58840.1 hypothetical protein GCM10008107_04890 [Psychrosphaera saromensis]GLQ14210.1 hypothetical protein GCM10007917_16650 [Psychrosphaera saromensis]
MAINGFKNNINIAFSLFVSICLGVVLFKTWTAQDSVIQGIVKNISCTEHYKKQDRFNYAIEIEDKGTFSNSSNLKCERFLNIQIGDEVTINRDGHKFTQITHDNINHFNENAIERSINGAKFIFILLFILATCDAGYRIFLRSKSRR